MLLLQFLSAYSSVLAFICLVLYVNVFNLAGGGASPASQAFDTPVRSPVSGNSTGETVANTRSKAKANQAKVKLKPNESQVNALPDKNSLLNLQPIVKLDRIPHVLQVKQPIVKLDRISKEVRFDTPLNNFVELNQPFFYRT